jgi:hypothetical protein
MYYNQKVYTTQNEDAVKVSYIRVFHASPDAPAVDVYANGNLIVSDLAYGEISDYLAVPPGRYTIEVYPAGDKTNPVFMTNTVIPEDAIITIAAIGMLDDLVLSPIPEPVETTNRGRACIRFIHLSPDAPPVDILLDDGTEVFTDVAFKEATDYACLPADTYSFVVTPAGSDTPVLTVPDIAVATNSYYTIYAVGLVEGKPALEAILIPES